MDSTPSPSGRVPSAPLDPQAILDVVRTLIVSLDTEGRVTLINPAGCQALGRPAEQIVGADWFEHFLPPADRDRTREAFDKIIRGHLEPVEYFENPVLTASGEQRMIAWHNALMRSAEGRIVGTLSSGHDITELRRLLQQARQDAEVKQHLLSELNHRVKNNLATVTSLMHIEKSNPTQSKDDFLDACLARLASLSELHSLLSEQVGGEIDADPLIRRVAAATVSASFRPQPKVAFRTDCRGLRISIDLAGGVAMAVNELLTNALRHGRKDTDAPAVAVALCCGPTDVTIEIADNGGGLPDGFDLGRHAGTGLKLVRFIAEKQLRGRLTLRREDEHTVARLSFPLPEGGKGQT